MKGVKSNKNIRIICVLKYKILSKEGVIMSKTYEMDNLVPTSTDMGVGLICNTDKIFPSDERWKYGDYDDESDKEKKNRRIRDDNHSDEELDADINTYMGDKKSVFRKENKEHKIHSNENTKSGRDTERERDRESDVKSDSEKASGLMKDKDLMCEKLDIMRKLGELKQCGVLLSRNYSIDSDLGLMECEYKLHHDIRSKQNSVQWMSHMLIGIVKGTEMFNDNYNPFDIKLTGLSNRISSDMHNYYSVLGDIYEKYNHPGKGMGPEMKLLLMLSGAALSMQVSKIPMMMGGNNPSNEVRNEEMLNELRKKAEQDSNLLDEKTKEYMKKQHDIAAQKITDLKMIQDKELEYQKISKLLNTKNGNMKNFKENLLLSESPKQSDTEKQSIDHTKELRLTQEEIEHIQKIKNMEEQQHLEMMRRIAHQKSESFRNNLHQINRDDKRRMELNLQNQQLDKIINNIDGPKSFQQNQSNANIPKNKNQSKKQSKQKQSEDTKSVQSNESSISVNPKIQNIMSKSKYSSSKQKTNCLFAPNDIKMDENIKLLLEQNESDYDNLSKDDISIGSSKDKKDKKKLVDFTQMSFGSKTKGSKPTLKTGK